MQQHSSHCKYCSVIFVMPQSWHAHLKACSTSMLGNTVRFRGRTTPDKIPSIMIFCKIFFCLGDALNSLSNITPWKLVSFRNIFMPVSWKSMTDTIIITATNCGSWTQQGPSKSVSTLSTAFLLSYQFGVFVTDVFIISSLWCFCH